MNESIEKSELSKQEIALLVYDSIRFLKDPEKDNTLEDLSVISEDLIKVENFGLDKYLIKLEFTPTVPHCSLATLIGLCIRVKLQRSLPFQYKINILLTKGSHDSEEEVNKQINDKERVAAALENPNLLKIVEECISDT